MVDSGGRDTEVLKKCGENGWVLISSDDSMRRVPENREAAVKYGAKVFLFSSGNRKGGEYKAALIVARFRIVKHARKAGPFFMRLNMDGTVSAQNLPLNRHRTLKAWSQ